MEIKIRKASIDDLALICQLSQSIFDYEQQFTDEFNMHWSHAEEGKKFFTKQLKSRKSFVLLAQDKDVVVGYVFVRVETIPWRSFNPIADVVNLGVIASYRGKGIGTRLFQQAKKLAIQRHAKRMSVSALSENPRTLNFYKRQGFGDFNVTMVLKLD
jgi:ribosomal protein S18 acetylase RimI-like enzyme